MKTIKIWNRNHITAYVLENIRSFSAVYREIYNAIPALPRPQYRKLLKTLKADVDLGRYRIGRKNQDQLQRMTLLSSLWKMTATADADGCEIRVETPVEIKEAALLLTELAEKDPEEQDELIKAADDAPPPAEMYLLSSSDILDIIKPGMADYDKRYTEIITKSASDPKGLKSLARDARRKYGPAVTLNDPEDAAALAAFAGRLSILDMITVSDDEKRTTTAESIAALDQAIEELHKANCPEPVIKKDKQISKTAESIEK